MPFRDAKQRKKQRTGCTYHPKKKKLQGQAHLAKRDIRPAPRRSDTFTPI